MNHIAQTIETLRESVNRAQATIEFLTQFQAGVDGPASLPTGIAYVPTPPERTTVGQPAQPIEELTRVARPAVPRGTRKQARPAPATPEALHTATSQLKEPFNAAQLRDAVPGAEYKQCVNFLNNRVVHKIVTRVGRGLFSRGPAFNGEKPLAVKSPPLSRIPRDGNVKPPTPVNGTRNPEVLVVLEKPTSVGAAMKLLIRDTPMFTGEGLRQKLEMDADYAKLLAESSPGVVAGNLTYWSSQGYLKRNGETPLESTYTVTSAGKEWFLK